MLHNLREFQSKSTFVAEIRITNVTKHQRVFNDHRPLQAKSDLRNVPWVLELAANQAPLAASERVSKMSKARTAMLNC